MNSNKHWKTFANTSVSPQSINSWKTSQTCAPVCPGLPEMIRFTEEVVSYSGTYSCDG